MSPCHIVYFPNQNRKLQPFIKKGSVIKSTG